MPDLLKCTVYGVRLAVYTPIPLLRGGLMFIEMFGPKCKNWVRVSNVYALQVNIVVTLHINSFG